MRVLSRFGAAFLIAMVPWGIMQGWTVLASMRNTAYVLSTQELMWLMFVVMLVAITVLLTTALAFVYAFAGVVELYDWAQGRG